MLWDKIKTVAVWSIVAGVAALGGAAALQRAEAHSAAGPGVAAQPVRPDQPAKAEPAVQADQPQEKGGAPKLYTVNFDNTPWREVPDWYSEISSLPFVSSNMPAGRLSLVGAKGKQYTLGEITDLLNEALFEKKFILVRRNASFTLVPADERIEPTLMPRVQLDELEKRGKTELVSVVLPLTNLSAKEIAGDIKKLMGPFGNVVALERLNQLVLQDTAYNLRQIRQMIRDLEARTEKAKEDAQRK